MTTEKEKKILLEKILTSSTFSKSINSQVLLRFLVNATLKKKELKESIIGLELFGDKYDPEKSDARVRVNVYNLRKKLERYYETEGEQDAFHLTIAKGQYHVQFLPPKKKSEEKKPRVQRLPWFITAGVVIIFLLHIARGYWAQAIPFWADFLNSDKTTTIYVGDVFNYFGPSPFSKSAVIRDYRINNLRDFIRFKDQHPELHDQVQPGHYTYLTYMGPYAANKLSYLFAGTRKELDVKLITRSDYTDIVSGNSIYIGPLKNDNRFIPLFNEKNRHITIEDGKIRVTNPEAGIDSVFTLALWNRQTEYALVSRIPGPEQTEQFLFFADHDTGVVGAIDYFTNPDSLKTFQDKLAGEKKYFTAILKVSGKERTKMNTELLLLDSFDN